MTSPATIFPTIRASPMTTGGRIFGLQTTEKLREKTIKDVNVHFLKGIEEFFFFRKAGLLYPFDFFLNFINRGRIDKRKKFENDFKDFVDHGFLRIEVKTARNKFENRSTSASRMIQMHDSSSGFRRRHIQPTI
jgi:hypothetical protein